MSGGIDDWATRQVIEFVARRTGREPGDIKLSERLAHLSIDSLDIVDLIAVIESELNVNLPDPARQIGTVGDLVELVRHSKLDRPH